MTMVTILVVCLLAAVAVVAVMAPRLRTRRLRERFGPEYDRTLLGHGGRVGEAERELSDRLRLARALDLKAIAPAERERMLEQLGRLQEMFVDDPGRAAAEADRLLTELLDQVGYPAKGRLESVSVHHGGLLPGYREARRSLERAQAVQVGTEELRTALLAIRELTLAVLRAERPSARPSPALSASPEAAEARSGRPVNPTPSAG
ncbi:hypothetical protein [Kitasatospora sp. NPDC057223]|uniref:hypothetical protein n=1 Tax=Kitasatospora sp. NPDC057223 TaxID=3346055 RepID=UPI0036270FCB